MSKEFLAAYAAKRRLKAVKPKNGTNQQAAPDSQEITATEPTGGKVAEIVNKLRLKGI